MILTMRTDIALNLNSPPTIGMLRFSARDITVTRPHGTMTMESRKLECGATTRIGASVGGAIRPLTFTLMKPMTKKRTLHSVQASA